MTNLTASDILISIIGSLLGIVIWLHNKLDDEHKKAVRDELDRLWREIEKQ